MIRGYFNFRVFSLLESILKVDPDFLSLIEKISDKGDPVAKFLYSLVSKDIKTNANYLKLSDKNDDLKFVNDTQVKRFIDAGQDPFERANNIAKIGRTVRQILTSNGISVTDQQIEKFVNSYKNEWDRKYKKESEGFNLISGEDIRNWYLEEKYVYGGGTLNNSCMRYRETQEFLDIYTNNPEVCQLLILVDNSNRLLGRALLWKLVDGTGKTPYYLDRIYTRFDSDAEKFVEWFENFIKITDRTKISSHYLGQTTGCRVQLKKWKFKKYPYMDTFGILNYEDGVLATYEGQDDKKLQFHIQNTGGDASVPNFKRSEKYDTWLHKSNAVYISSLQDYIPTEYCVKDYQDDWIWKEEAVYSDYYKKYVSKGQAVELEGFGLVDSSDIVTVYDAFDGRRLGGEKEYLLTLIGESDYVRVEMKWSSHYVNKKIASYDVYNSEWILMSENFNENYINLYKIDDENLEKLSVKFGDNFEVINIYYNGYGLVDKYTRVPFVIERSDENYVTKEVLEAFDLTTLEGNNCMKFNTFYRGYVGMIYQRTIELLNKKDIVNKELIISLLDKANSYLTENSGDYNNANKFYPNLIKYGSYTSYFNTEIANKFKESNLEKLVNSKDSCDRLVEFLKRHEFSFSYIHDREDIDVKYRDENLYDQCVTFLNRNKDVMLFYAYWYILLNDTDYANYKLNALVVDKDIESYSFRQLVKYYNRYEEASDKFSENVNSIRRWFDDNFNYQKLLGENNTSRGSEDISDINKIYNDFLEKLNNK
jgi:hypothetical protein